MRYNDYSLLDGRIHSYFMGLIVESYTLYNVNLLSYRDSTQCLQLWTSTSKNAC